jgi:hypothetical protein
MVCTRNPKNPIAVHSLVAAKDILERVVERMAICKDPITLGGGMTLEKIGPFLSPGLNAPDSIQWAYHLDSTPLWP